MVTVMLTAAMNFSVRRQKQFQVVSFPVDQGTCTFLPGLAQIHYEHKGGWHYFTQKFLLEK